MYAPAVWHVVKDGSRASLVIDPRQECDGTLGVQPTTIREQNVTVASSVEMVRTVACSVWSWRGTDVTYDSARIATKTYILTLYSTIERENCYSLGFNCEQE